MAVIAEIKRRSPSAGDLAPDLDAAKLGRAYAAGGAACLSVLTDAPHFGGSAEDLRTARRASGLPVLRKDFTVSERDLYDARAMGADAVLLIVAALGDEELTSFLAVGRDLGLDCLVEVHDEVELERALAAGAELVGVNQRDLRSFTVDRARAARVGAAIPDGVVAVAESGIRDRRLMTFSISRRRVSRRSRRRGLRHLAASLERRRGVLPRRRSFASGLAMFVKVCGITTEEDALLAVAMGADAVGFVFSPSPRRVSPAVAGQIASRLPPQVVTVGVFRDELPERVVEIVNTAGLKAAQLHGRESSEVVAHVATHVRHVIKAFPATSATSSLARRVSRPTRC